MYIGASGVPVCVKAFIYVHPFFFTTAPSGTIILAIL